MCKSLLGLLHDPHAHTQGALAYTHLEVAFTINSNATEKKAFTANLQLVTAFSFLNQLVHLQQYTTPYLCSWLDEDSAAFKYPVNLGIFFSRT